MLVRFNRQAAVVRRALSAAGVPAVDYGSGSVFATEIADQWLTLLESLERPAELARARSAALTCFIGWSAERLAQSGGDPDAPEWERVHRLLHDWSRVLRIRGVAALLERIMVSEHLAERVLADAGGERRMTDLRHIGQLLHAAATADHLGLTALTAWLRARIDEAGDEGDEERSRRLESDADAVQVLTIHRSKGLEFPIVFLPFLWDMGRIRERTEPVFFHDQTNVGTLDVGLEGAGYRAHRDASIVEQRGEDLRLAYVALTRARHQNVDLVGGKLRQPELTTGADPVRPRGGRRDRRLIRPRPRRTRDGGAARDAGRSGTARDLDRAGQAHRRSSGVVVAAAARARAAVGLPV